MTGRGSSPPVPPPWWDGPAGRASPAGPAPPLPWTGGAGTATARGPARGAAGASAAGLLAVGVLVGVLLVALTVHLATGPGPVTTPILSYKPPAGWSAAAPDPAAADVPALVGVVHGPGYPCGGEELVRGFAAAALLPTDATASPAERAERVVRWFADATFSGSDGTPPEVTVAPPRPVQVAGPDGPVDGTVTEAGVRAPGGQGGCAATAGRVLVLAVPHGAGVALLLVAGDTGGGPADPAPPEPSTLDAVVGSVRLPAA